MNTDKLDDLLHKVLMNLSGHDAGAGLAVLARAIACVVSEIIMNTDAGDEVIDDLDGMLSLIKKEIRTRINKHNSKVNFELNQ